MPLIRSPKIFYGYIIVVAAFLVIVAIGVGVYTFGVFLKPVAEEFGWNRAMTSGAYSVTMFVTAFLSMVAGALSDRFGPRAVTTVCGIFFGLGYLLMSQIGTLWQLYLFWGVMIGIGMSGGFVPMSSTVARWFVKRRGMMTGIVVAGVGVGTMIGPPVSSHLIQSYGWRTAYFIVGLISLALLTMVAQLLKRNPGQIGQLPYGASEVKHGQPASPVGGFYPREAFRSGQLWMLFTIYLLFGISQMAVMVHIVPYATDHGISPTVAANILTVIGGASMVGRVIMGTVSDRIGNKTSLVINLVLLTSALLWLQQAQVTWRLYLFAAIFGFAYGGEIALMSPVVAELFGLKAHGAIMGMVSLTYHLGGAVGPLLAGYMFDSTSSYQLAFTVLAALNVGGLVVTLLLRPARAYGFA